MKLDVDVNEVVLSNVGTTGEFRIKNSAKAFKILSDGLYSNKIRAIIRELSCNAVDSHTAAGKSDVPFEVHLPTILEPWFAVRDFGTGLDGDQVVNIYTTYFESTKTASNDFIGALGLGSKSPFSYTENFTVTAVKNGTKRIYSAFINEQGIPCVAEMSEELTDDPNGVEVKFSVTDRYDYQSFRHEAQAVFQWFKLKPIVTGLDGFTHTTLTYKERNIVPGVHVTNSYGESTAIMGNIAYPIRVSEPQKYFGNLASLLECNLHIEFGIGELDFAASREQLSYVPLTLNSIKKKLEELNSQLAIHIATKANAITCEWQRAEFLQTESQHKLFKSAVLKYVTDTKFELFDPNAYYGKKSFKFYVDQLSKDGLEIRGMRVSARSCSRHSVEREYDAAKKEYIDLVSIPVEMDTVIVLNDLKTGCYARARYHFMNFELPSKKHSVNVFCLSHSDTDMTVRQTHYDAFLKKLHNPPHVFKASELEKEVRVKDKAAVGTQGLMMLELRNDRYRRSNEYVWRPVASEPDPKQKHYYVALNAWSPEYLDGKPFDIAELKNQLDKSGIPALNNIAVIGVRKNRIKDISPLKNWVWIEDKVKEEIGKITTAQVEAIVAAETLDNYNTKVYTSWDAVRLLDPSSEYAKYLNKYAKLQRNSGTDLTYLVSLCDKFGKTFVVDNIKKQILAERDALYKKYPMLKYLVHSQVTGPDLAHYIALVDKQEKI